MRQQRSSTWGAAFAACLLVGAVAGAAGAQDVDVEIIKGPPPSAESLAGMLYPDNGPAQGTTRSIRLGDTPVVPKKAVAVGMLIQFDYNSANIKPESKPYLDEIGRMMHLEQAESRKLRVEGHADASGSDSYNQTLSERRAQAVASYLIRTHDVAPSRLEVAGKGESQPLKDHSPSDPENRRVQFQGVE